jgi:hypothetical protein
LPFEARGSEIARYENVAMSAEIPVDVGFAANAGSTGYVFFGFRRGGIGFAQAFSRGPADSTENQSGDDRH